jgi:predicted outer membrane repeat protein
MLIAGSNFESNAAEIKGGAIYYECEELTFNCKLEIRDTNSFSTNTAGESGGAIYWGQVEPVFNTISKR